MIRKLGAAGVRVPGGFATELPPPMADAIVRAYRELSHASGRRALDVAVRSSATAEDLPQASFAGQQETFLNIRGDQALLAACQPMVRSDRGAAGVMFTIDTETGFSRAVQISASWGLGETVVQGNVDPDEYVVFKPLLGTAGVTPIIHRRRGTKARKLVYAWRDARPTRVTAPAQRSPAADTAEHAPGVLKPS